MTVSAIEVAPQMGMQRRAGPYLRPSQGVRLARTAGEQ
jgi:hypothetical protein